MSEQPLLTAHEVVIYRGESPLINRVSLSVCAGEAVQIVGSNGAGKTTLLHGLCGLLPLDDGEIAWCGEPLGFQSRQQFYRDLIYIGHKPGIKMELTPTENLAVDVALAGLDETDIPHALQALGLGAQAHLPCRVLSAGQRRRVALSRLMIRPAKLWILDEPYTALDATGRAQVNALMASHLDAGGAIVCTSHQPIELSTGITRHLDISA